MGIDIDAVVFLGSIPESPREQIYADAWFMLSRDYALFFDELIPRSKGHLPEGRDILVNHGDTSHFDGDEFALCTAADLADVKWGDHAINVAFGAYVSKLPPTANVAFVRY